jgi:mono/diheme cytochrome c family protein
MFSMATYAALMRGSEAGRVIVPKDGKGSRMIELIEAGDMPRGGARVTPDELALLTNWINEGARFDGQDPNQPIAALVPAAANAATPMLTVVQATGKETVSFARELAPILVEQCVGCHGEGNGQPGGQFNMATFTNLLRGGQSGPPWVPGKPDDSLLVQKLKGTAGGQRMPRGRPPLPDESIAKFAKWIEEGATFDGLGADVATRRVAAVAQALAASHEQLAAERLTRAQEYWQLSMPGVQPDVVQTEQLIVLGNIGPKSLQELAKQAEQTSARVAALLKAPGGKLLVKGKIVLFVFDSRYRYGEFGRMVEQRQLPADWRGHWRFDTVDAYGAMVASRNDEYDNQALLAQVLAGAYVASLGGVPGWFAEGAGRMAAARLAPRDARVAAWDAQVSGLLPLLQQPDDFLTGKLPADAADLCAYRFTSFLLVRDARRFSTLLKNISDGFAFDQAFLRVYGATPNQLAALWYQSELRGGR